MNEVSYGHWLQIRNPLQVRTSCFLISQNTIFHTFAAVLFLNDQVIQLCIQKKGRSSLSDLCFNRVNVPVIAKFIPLNVSPNLWINGIRVIMIPHHQHILGNLVKTPYVLWEVNNVWNELVLRNGMLWYKFVWWNPFHSVHTYIHFTCISMGAVNGGVHSYASQV